MSTLMIKNNYFDEWGRLHDKPCINSKASSNNGFIYSAYWTKLTGEFTVDEFCGEYCAAHRIRHVDKESTPISRDEILGLAYLGFLKPYHLKGWNFSPFLLPRFNLLVFIVHIILCVGQHRNFFWKYKLDQVYHVAFSVPLTDRHFLNKCWGRYNLFYHLVHVIDSLLGESAIRYLKYGKSEKALRDYFKFDDHPIKTYKKV